MNKTLAILLAAVFAGAFIPAAEGAETVTQAYTGALGFSATGIHEAAYLGLIICYATCDFNDPCIEDTCVPTGGLVPIVNPIGGLDLYASSAYSNVIVTVSDDIYGSDAAMSACFINEDFDNPDCSPDEDYPTENACGPATLLGSPFSSDFVSVFLFSILVEDDLTTCGGSTGSVTGDFF